VEDKFTAYLRALVELLDADAAAIAAYGRPDAGKAYDRREAAKRAIRERQCGLNRKDVADALRWRVAVSQGDRAREAVLSLGPRRGDSLDHREAYRAKDAAGAEETAALAAMRRGVLAGVAS
jgi:hypothetical protein